jgi:hypothetical protein
MGKDIRSGPLGNVGIGEIRIGSRPSNVRVPRVSRTWGLLPLIPSWPELLRVAPPRIVVRHCRLGTGRRSTRIPGTGRRSTRIPGTGRRSTRIPPRQAFSAPEDVPGESGDCHPEDPFFRKEFCEEEQEG